MGRPGLSQHRKFRRLTRDLNSEAIARGSLELLCDSCYESGDLSAPDLEIDEFNRRFAAGCWIKISEHLHITSDYHEKKVGPQRVQR